MSKSNECINCGGGLIITPAYPVSERTIYCGNCGLTPNQAADEPMEEAIGDGPE